mmetsp:Transcript_16195/g.35887  ORF Transcript_16195/g.35887 Transcript_16195/m.35887 type:complete len:260 (-) Transcript_16195:47-826(-)
MKAPCSWDKPTSPLQSPPPSQRASPHRPWARARHRLRLAPHSAPYHPGDRGPARPAPRSAAHPRALQQVRSEPSPRTAKATPPATARSGKHHHKGRPRPAPRSAPRPRPARPSSAPLPRVPARLALRQVASRRAPSGQALGMGALRRHLFLRVGLVPSGGRSGRPLFLGRPRLVRLEGRARLRSAEGRRVDRHLDDALFWFWRWIRALASVVRTGFLRIDRIQSLFLWTARAQPLSHASAASHPVVGGLRPPHFFRFSF